MAGYQTEYAGMKFALFYLGSYINLVLSALLVSVLYLGGWGFPIPVEWLAGWLGQSVDAPLVQVITGTVGIVMTVLKVTCWCFSPSCCDGPHPACALISCSTWAGSSFCLWPWSICW